MESTSKICHLMPPILAFGATPTPQMVLSANMAISPAHLVP